MSLRQRGSGTWELRVWNGKKQISKTIYTTRKREAEKAYNDFKREIEDKNAPSNKTFGDLLHKWLAFIEPERSPYTIHGYRWRIDKHIIPELGDLRLHKLRAVDIDNFYTKLRNRGLKATSVRQYHAIIRRALEQAIKWDELSFNPALKATPPKVITHQIEGPTTEQVEQVIELAERHSPEVLMFVHLAAVTGARRGELCALRFSDLKGSDLHISASLYEVGATVGEKGTKSNQNRRVDLGPETLSKIAEYKNQMTARAEKVGTKLDKDAYMFSLVPDGSKPWRPSYIGLAFRRLRDKAGIKTLRLHDLRHYQASQLIHKGVAVVTVQKRLGHAQASTTLNLYAHPSQEADKEAAKIADDLLK